MLHACFPVWSGCSCSTKCGVSGPPQHKQQAKYDVISQLQEHVEALRENAVEEKYVRVICKNCVNIRNNVVCVSCCDVSMITDLSSADFARLDVVVLIPGQQATGAESQPSQDCHQSSLLLLYGLATIGCSHHQLLNT